MVHKSAYLPDQAQSCSKHGAVELPVKSVTRLGKHCTAVVHKVDQGPGRSSREYGTRMGVVLVEAIASSVHMLAYCKEVVSWNGCVS